MHGISEKRKMMKALHDFSESKHHLDSNPFLLLVCVCECDSKCVCV